MFPDSVSLHKQENGCFDQTTLRRKILCETKKKLKVEMITPLKKAFQNETLHDSNIHKRHRTFTDDREPAEIGHVGEKLRTGMMNVNINTVLVLIGEDCHSSV